MKPGTAPGEDSIPAEFFTLFMHPEAGDLGAPRESSETPMGRALFQLPASNYLCGESTSDNLDNRDIRVPESWQSSVRVVVPLENFEGR
jgi:hypothetical protein